MADEVSPNASGTCAVCRKSATQRCSGCLDAPKYDEDIVQKTFYCSSECQRAHWPQHKSDCKKLQARKSVARAALLLQGIMLSMRKQAWQSFNVKSARREGSTIVLEVGDPVDPFTRQRCFEPFSVRCDEGDRDLLESVLMNKACTEAMIYLQRFVEELLSGKQS